MIFDPLSAIVVVSAIGVSGLLKSKDDVIVKYIENRFISIVDEPHRIVVEPGTFVLAKSEPDVIS
jgi:hypothetical protein